VGGVTKRASSFIYIIPSTYTGENFGFINFEHLNPMGELYHISCKIHLKPLSSAD